MAQIWFSSVDTALQTARQLRRWGRTGEARRILDWAYELRASQRVETVLQARMDNIRTRLDLDEAGARPRIVWLLSYPRTGSTWLRFMLTHLIGGPFDTSAAVNRITPTLEYGTRTDSFADGRTVFVKTHYRLDAFLREAEDLADFTVGAIYVARHPADVLASCFNYMRRQAYDPEDVLGKQGIAGYAEGFIKELGEAHFVRLGHGSYLGHFTEWTLQPLIREMEIVRYEDMIADPAVVLGRIAARWSLDLPADRVAEAAAACSFERMRDLEAQEKAKSDETMLDSLPSFRFTELSAFPPAFVKEGGQKDIRFVNRGEAGYGRELLSAEQLARLNAAFGSLMQRLGYA